MKLLAVVLTAVLGAACTSSQPPRGAAPAPLAGTSPTGAVEWPFEFRWTGAGPATVVRVHVFDDAERPLVGFEARGDHLAAPDALRSTLRAGVRYQWRVARVDENGEEADPSAPTAFEISEIK